MEFQFNKTMKGPSMEEMVEMVLNADQVSPQECVEEKNEVEYTPGFLQRLEEHKVATIGEDDYTFWDFLFGEGWKERKRW